DDDVYGDAYQLGGQSWQPVQASVRVAILDDDIRAGRPAQFAEPRFEVFLLAEGVVRRRLARREDTHARRARRLGIGHERQGEECEQQDAVGHALWSDHLTPQD